MATGRVAGLLRRDFTSRLRHYRGDLVSVLIAYNAGPRSPASPLPRNGETPAYVLAVLRAYRFYAKNPGALVCSSLK